MLQLVLIIASKQTATSLRSISKDVEPTADLDYSDNSGSEDDIGDDDISAASKTLVAMITFLFCLFNFILSL